MMNFEKLGNIVKKLNEFDEKFVWSIDIAREGTFFKKKFFVRIIRRENVIKPCDYEEWIINYEEALDFFANALISICEKQKREYEENVANLKREKEFEGRVYKTINHDFLKMEKDFCIDPEEFDVFLYDIKDLERINEIFDYLERFTAASCNKSDYLPERKFRDLKIRSNLVVYNQKTYQVSLAGVDICRIIFMINDNDDGNLSTDTRVYIQNDDYVKHVAYMFDYILEYKKHFEELEKQNQAKHLDSVLENYYC